ncbi:MAG: lipoyl(octanoyl) transferase LipB [Thermoleophilia bacterium]|nr:lipoyl(octanoyl) transferase LipB [Thermoleophilia bacterium]
MGMPVPAWVCDLGRAEYVSTARLQRSLRAAREAGALPDTLLLVEHEAVITTGSRTEPHEVAYALTTDVPVVPTDRGGKATWHGPGQIVAYPVLDLKRHGNDVRAFVRALEQGIIDTLIEFGVEADRRDGYPGVWVEDRKIASVGARVTKWITFHGIALNVDCDLSPFTWFTPCGIPDVEMTSIAAEVHGLSPSVAEVRGVLSKQLQVALDIQCTDVPRARLVKVAEQFVVEDPSFGAERTDTPVFASEPDKAGVSS